MSYLYLAAQAQLDTHAVSPAGMVQVSVDDLGVFAFKGLQERMNVCCFWPTSLRQRAEHVPPGKRCAPSPGALSIDVASVACFVS